jgi:putative cell wall-binding protein
MNPAPQRTACRRALATGAALSLVSVAWGGVSAAADQVDAPTVEEIKSQAVVQDDATVRPELSPAERVEIAGKIADAAADEIPAARTFSAQAEGDGATTTAAGYTFDDSLLLGGADRYETAMLASWYSGLGDWDGDGAIGDDEMAAPVVYVVSGRNFPDALSAAAPAAYNGGVLLMTKTDTLPASTSFELERLQPEKIVLVGGTAAISTKVGNQIADLTDAAVERRAGSTRYETARAVIETGYPDGLLNPFVYVTSGVNYPDALAAGAPAALFGVPVVLVDGRKNTIDAETLAFLDSQGIMGAEIAGGTAAVSAGIQAQLEGKYGTEGQVLRSSGATRYETAAALVEAAHGYAYDSTRSDEDPANDFLVYDAFFASGRNFPDALGGGTIAGYFGEPFYPLDERCGAAPAVADSLTHLEPEYSIFLGGQLRELHGGVMEDGVLPTC